MTLLVKSMQLHGSCNRSWYISTSHVYGGTEHLLNARISDVLLHRVRFNKQPNHHDFVDFFVEFTNSYHFIKIKGTPRTLTESVRANNDRLTGMVT